MRQKILLGRGNRTNILTPLLLARDPPTKEHRHQLLQLDKVEAEQVAQSAKTHERQATSDRADTTSQISDDQAPSTATAAL